MPLIEPDKMGKSFAKVIALEILVLLIVLVLLCYFQN